MRRTMLLVVGFLVSALACSPRCEAALEVTFNRISSNNVEDLSGQLGLSIMASSEALSSWGQVIQSDEVLMVLTNHVGISSSISEFYIDDESILTQEQVLNSLSGFTDFTGGGANPANLPGGQDVDPPFVATAGLSADAVGNSANGVDSLSDALGLVYSLQSTGLTNGEADLTKISSYINSGELRFGIHATSVGAASGSDSYVNVSEIPEPAGLAVWALLVSSGFGGFIARRRRNRS